MWASKESSAARHAAAGFASRVVRVLRGGPLQAGGDRTQCPEPVRPLRSAVSIRPETINGSTVLRVCISESGYPAVIAAADVAENRRRASLS